MVEFLHHDWFSGGRIDGFDVCRYHFGHTILPFVAYAALLAGGKMLFVLAAQALFTIAGGIMLLIFIGIRNAWDIVTYIAIRGDDESPQASGP
jgi:hypothetical protein